MTLQEKPSGTTILQSVSDGIDDVIYISDPDTYELLHVNDTAARIWGRNVVGKKCYAILQDRDSPCPFCTNGKIFGEHLGQNYVWEFQNEVNQRWYRCSDKAIPWSDGRMVRFELAADITELKRTEQQLRHTVEKLAQSNQDLQQFAYVASHDLQEPLRMVSSFTQLLSDRYADQLDEKAQSWIHYAVDGAQRMQILIQDLLSFSRVNTHGNEFSRINLSIPASQAIQNLSLRIEETGAVIDTQALPSLPVDGTQITQLFQNLLANALKFSDHQPQIRIRAAEKKSHWVLSVEDNGIGIDPEFQKKVFIIFQRLHTRSQYPGTGLGLAVCKRIIQRHGGRIWVASEPGKGSVFSFSLPKE